MGFGLRHLFGNCSPMLYEIRPSLKLQKLHNSPRSKIAKLCWQGPRIGIFHECVPKGWLLAHKMSPHPPVSGSVALVFGNSIRLASSCRSHQVRIPARNLPPFHARVLISSTYTPLSSGIPSIHTPLSSGIPSIYTPLSSGISSTYTPLGSGISNTYTPLSSGMDWSQFKVNNLVLVVSHCCRLRYLREKNNREKIKNR